MSGSSPIPPIPLRLDGKEAVERGLEDVARAAERMAQRTAAGAQQMGTLSTVADDVGGKLGTLSTRATALSTVLDRLGAGPAAQGLGTLATVLDGAALAASRVGASTAAAETGVSSFFARMATGATIIGTVVVGLQAAGLGINAAGEGALRASDYTTQYQGTLESLNTVLGTTAQRAQEAALALWRTNQQAALVRVETSLGRTFEQRSTGVTEFNRTEADLAAARARLQRAEERSGRGSFAANSAADALRAEVDRLEGQRARLVVRNADLNNDEAELAARRQDLLRQGGPDDLYGPAAPVGAPRSGGGGGGGGGGRAPDPRDPVTGYTAAQQARLDRLREAEEREAQRTAEREARELERREERNNRVTDRITDYAAERLLDLTEKGGRGWAGMWETMEKTGKATLARIAAELVLRPVIAPIVSGLGLGSLGTGNGGFSGIGGLLGGGGAVATTSDVGANTGGGGGLLSGLGQARSLFGMGGGGGSGGGFLSSVLNYPLWTSGGGFFGAPAVASGGFLPAGATSLPAMSGATTGLGAGGGLTLGGFAAGAGAGYAAGSLIGRYTAGNSPARQQNAQLGAAGGAAAGAIIGSIIPGVGTVIGGLVGGAIGGGGGGLIGPGAGFSGGDVGIGVGPDGMLVVTGAGGKRFDSAGATDQTRAQLDQINAVLRAAGVTIDGSARGGPQLGWQGFGQSRNQFGPTEIFGAVRGSLSSANPMMQSLLSQRWLQSFEDLGVVAPYAVQNGNLSNVLASGRIQSRDDFTSASQFITSLYEPLSKVKDYTADYAAAIGAQLQVYDQAIARARELGLAEEGLVAARQRAQVDLTEARNRSVFNTVTGLEARELMLSGNPADVRRGQIMDFNLQSANGRVQLRDFLRGSGYGDETDLFREAMERFTRVTQLERTQFVTQRDFAASASGRSLMEDLTVGGLGGLTSAGRYAAGLKSLNDARQSGDLDRITQAARSILPVARDYLGTSERFGALVADISRDVGRLGGDPVGLGVFLDAQAAGNQALERIYGLTNSQLSELKGMRQELSRLNAVIVTLMQRERP